MVFQTKLAEKNDPSWATPIDDSSASYCDGAHHGGNEAGLSMTGSGRCKMKSRNLLFLLACFIASSVFVYLLSDQRPTLHTIVTETHKQLNNLKDNLKATERKELITDKKYLKALGFTANPRLYPTSVWHNVTLPIVVTAVSSGDAKQAIGFVGAVRHHLPDRNMVIYDLGLGDFESSVIAQICNTSCFVKQFNFNDYPAHVGDVSIKAYRPLIIQEMLNLAGAVFWLDVNCHLVTGKIDTLVQRASSVGLVTWSRNQPTSALTHPRMFEYFHTQQQNFYFHHMAEPEYVMVYNTKPVHRQLMLPWVQCALTFECIAPIGAQSSGCRFDKKPMYRYSGCHRYDASAFNVALGVMFHFDDSKYAAQDRVFKLVPNDVLTDDGRELGTGNDNETALPSDAQREEYIMS